jgi:hypothetical protein
VGLQKSSMFETGGGVNGLEQMVGPAFMWTPKLKVLPVKISSQVLQFGFYPFSLNIDHGTFRLLPPGFPKTTAIAYYP